MGKHKNADRGGANAQKGTSPSPLSHEGEAGHNLRDNVASLEEGLSQMGVMCKTPFRSLQSSWLPSEQSLWPEHWQDYPA